MKTLKELIAKAKAEPGKLNYASGGIGAATFIVTEVLKAQAQIDMVHVPYNGGGPALASILSGVTDIYGSPYTTAKPFVDEGKLVGLAVSSAQRIPYMPDMPTVAETLPGYEVTTWHGLMLPADTPLAIRDKLQAAMTQAVNTPETQKAARRTRLCRDCRKRRRSSRNLSTRTSTRWPSSSSSTI